MPNNQPYEIISGPFTIYIAPTGTTFPAINAVPTGAWLLLGAGGDKNISEDGVTISPSHKLTYVRMSGSTGPRKAYRTEEDLKIAFKLADARLEMLSKVFNGNTVTSVAAASGAAGYKHMEIQRGLSVTEYALLARGQSPEGVSWNLQLEAPKVIASSEPIIIAKKGVPVEVAFEFMALEDDTFAYGPFGRLVVGTADPLA